MFVKATDLGMPHLAKIGLTTKESTIIEFVGNNPEASQKEIARETGTKQSLLVTILDSLTKRNLLVRERSAVDRRRQHVRLTDKGEALRDAIKELQHASNEDLIDAAGLTAEEVQTLAYLMQKVANS